MARRRALLTAFLVALLVTCLEPGAAAAPGSSRRSDVARGPGGGFQPDGWIKLCGLSLGCVIDPLPHPWLGKNVYNTTGRRQTVAIDINEGEGVRFWITVENDGTESNSFGVQGCRGNRTYEVNRVLLGKHKRQDAGATDLTTAYRNGTLTFDLEPGEQAVFTLNIITHFNKGVTYECITAIRSMSEPGSEDAVIAEMTTY